MVCCEMYKQLNLFFPQILHCFVLSDLYIHQPLCDHGFLHGNCHKIIFLSQPDYCFPSAPVCSPQHLVVAQILSFA